jgi:hypothetical protein
MNTIKLKSHVVKILFLVTRVTFTQILNILLKSEIINLVAHTKLRPTQKGIHSIQQTEDRNPKFKFPSRGGYCLLPSIFCYPVYKGDVNEKSRRFEISKSQ